METRSWDCLMYFALRASMKVFLAGCGLSTNIELCCGGMYVDVGLCSIGSNVVEVCRIGSLDIVELC